MYVVHGLSSIVLTEQPIIVLVLCRGNVRNESSRHISIDGTNLYFVWKVE